MIDDPLVKTLLTNVVEDESNLPIVQALIDGVETDEEIANKTKIKLNIVRRILYRLYDMGLASYKRSKDPETQWFTYSWKFEKDEVMNRIIKDSENYLKILNDELEREENNMFFLCPQGHVRLDFDDSSEYEFICPMCGEELEFHENKDTIKQLKEDIKMVESNFKSFSEKNR
ncbi:MULTISPECIES: transcription factor E [unclassified Methanobrevibacter]|uniref:transcription factor E n=1 Tax=unclassified Methanobrevibacter TaxID=2638681 RepID=UPI002735F1F2|nr:MULTISPECIES: transcription factor E [unclassified Methanobrevibacter]